MLGQAERPPGRLEPTNNALRARGLAPPPEPGTDGALCWAPGESEGQAKRKHPELSDCASCPFLFLHFVYWLQMERKGEREREKHGFVVPLIDVLIS